MKIRKLALSGVFLAMAALAGSCSGETAASGVEICDNNKDDNNDGLTDCQDPLCRRHLIACQSADGSVADFTGAFDGSPDAALPDIALQSVANKMILPLGSVKVGLDLTGDNKVDNRLGDLLGGLLVLHPTMDLQKDVDEQLTAGVLLLLQEIRSGSLKDSTKARLQFFFGKDLDKNAKDNFSGTEWFGLDPNLSTTTPLTGTIKSGVATFGPGEIMVPLALGKVYAVVTLKLAKVTAKVTSKGMTEGVIAGAMPISDVKSSLLPGLATEMTRQYQDKANLTPQGKILLEYFDKNKDGTITVKELSGNPLIKTLILDQPDVDTDGDKKPDAVSAGIGFISVPCKIQRTE